ncbi:MAG: SAM-dependent methyltransferase [Flavobacteriaceae bacterium]|nr:MAG: SAM-dependent methyltransferase [Flavobacteriaceae bacterium]
MKKIIDNFSTQAKTYKKYRPVYPKTFYDALLNLTDNKDACWDCGTGNGQVASVLSKYFKTVSATDISDTQLQQAVPIENVRYSQQRAEETNFKSNTFDLITVAQAAHWFDFDAFYNEVNRVAKKNAILAIWGYELLYITPEIDAIINTFYTEIVGPYWSFERKHIDTHYDSIGFPFTEIKLAKDYEIKTELSLSDLEGYFNSWSSVQNYIRQKKENPVNQLINEIRPLWEQNETKIVSYPLFTKIGKITR